MASAAPKHSIESDSLPMAIPIGPQSWIGLSLKLNSLEIHWEKYDLAGPSPARPTVRYRLPRWRRRVDARGVVCARAMAHCAGSWNACTCTDVVQVNASERRLYRGQLLRRRPLVDSPRGDPARTR